MYQIINIHTGLVLEEFPTYGAALVWANESGMKLDLIINDDSLKCDCGWERNDHE